MPHYIKACPVCFKQFYTERIGKVFDTRRCRNKARSFPAKLMESLLEKANRATRVVETVPKAVRDYMLRHKEDYITSATTQDRIVEDFGIQDGIEALGLDKVDQDTIIREAKELKKQRDMQRIEKEIESENNNSLQFIDPDMIDFKMDDLSQITKSSLKYVNTIDPAIGNADGFGVGSDGSIKAEVLPQPRVSKLRRVGEKQ